MKTIENNPKMRTAFRAMSMKLNVLQAYRATIGGYFWAFAGYPQ
jgi:hypothetical protein